MSTCGDCDCADKSQCVKKGNNYTVDVMEIEKSHSEEVVDGAVAAGAEHGGQCKCGTACACVDCHCGK